MGSSLIKESQGTVVGSSYTILRVEDFGSASTVGKKCRKSQVFLRYPLQWTPYLRLQHINPSTSLENPISPKLRS